MATLLIIFATVFVLGPIAKAYADRLSRGSLPETEASRLELARLREEVERLSSDVSKLRDEQSFLLRLLNDGDRIRLPGKGSSSE